MHPFMTNQAKMKFRCSWPSSSGVVNGLLLYKNLVWKHLVDDAQEVFISYMIFLAHRLCCSRYCITDVHVPIMELTIGNIVILTFL